MIWAQRGSYMRVFKNRGVQHRAHNGIFILVLGKPKSGPLLDVNRVYARFAP